MLGVVEQKVGENQQIETRGRVGFSGGTEVGEERSGGGAPEITRCRNDRAGLETREERGAGSDILGEVLDQFGIGIVRHHNLCNCY